MNQIKNPNILSAEAKRIYNKYILGKKNPIPFELSLDCGLDSSKIQEHIDTVIFAFKELQEVGAINGFEAFLDKSHCQEYVLRIRFS
jgi:hypothetical protein